MFDQTIELGYIFTVTVTSVADIRFPTQHSEEFQLGHRPDQAKMKEYVIAVKGRYEAIYGRYGEQRTQSKLAKETRLQV